MSKTVVIKAYVSVMADIVEMKFGPPINLIVTIVNIVNPAMIIPIKTNARIIFKIVLVLFFIIILSRVSELFAIFNLKTIRINNNKSNIA
jgi:hypothetical protein